MFGQKMNHANDQQTNRGKKLNKKKSEKHAPGILIPLQVAAVVVAASLT